MLVGSVYNQLVDTLKENPTLKSYVHNVFKGVRKEIDQDSMPCLMIEPSANNEVYQDIGQYKRVYLDCDIFAYVHSASEPDKAIVGDDNYKGILDVDNDIRACLQASFDLGCKAINIEIQPSAFEVSDYPIRGLLMPIRVLYEQTEGK